MDRIGRLIERYRALEPEDDEKAAIVAELDGESAHGFLASVLADPDEHELARVECATALRLYPPVDEEARREAGEAVVAALSDHDEDLVRQHAAMALGPYADHPVVHRVMAAAMRSDDDVNVRHNAAAACAEAGPSEERTRLVSELLADDELGSWAARTLERWA
ncbi:HEAT repeat domain-containing protein [Saccharopolyspora kobensis]|uniref:HEAT repeat domain-containing protein n=1 Tax=Saccharopolyspora kobensis TaxID=146035 RepID=UPI001C435806|nr:HEAT repeat domain-containing protein [Saccharopolyspora kobensis]